MIVNTSTTCSVKVSWQRQTDHITPAVFSVSNDLLNIDSLNELVICEKQGNIIGNLQPVVEISEDLLVYGGKNISVTDNYGLMRGALRT